MFFQLQPIALGSHAAEAYICADKGPNGGGVAESPSQYRPRHPERSAFYQLFETHFDSYVRVYEERFEPRSGPLRPVVVRSVEEFLSCGRLQGGFARVSCTKWLKALRNNSGDTPDVRLRTGRLFSQGLSERRQNLRRRARNSGLAGIFPVSFLIAPLCSCPPG